MDYTCTWFIIQKFCKSIVFSRPSRDKSRFYQELDTKVQTSRISYSRRKIREYIVDETLIKVDSEHIWPWVETGPKDREILALAISKETCFLPSDFISGLVQIYGAHSINRWGNWVPTGMQVSPNKAPYPFSFGEKPDRKNYAVHQGQNRMFRRLFSMQKKEM